jgi:hypothetical protein
MDGRKENPHRNRLRGLLSLVVSQCDSLGRDLEVNNSGGWRGVSSQCLRCGFGDGLRPSE